MSTSWDFVIVGGPTSYRNVYYNDVILQIDPAAISLTVGRYWNILCTWYTFPFYSRVAFFCSWITLLERRQNLQNEGSKASCAVGKALNSNRKRKRKGDFQW